MQKKQSNTATRKIKHKTHNNSEIAKTLQQGKYNKIQTNDYTPDETETMPSMVVPLQEEIITNERQYRKNKSNNHTNQHNNLSEYSMSKIIKKVEILQQHPKYALMKQCNQQLMANELFALIYYLDHNSCYHKTKQSYEHWKHLHFYITNAIAKMHHVFYYKNNNKLPKMLYHTSSILCNQQPNFHKLAIYSTNLSTNNCGIILIINRVDEQLRSGVLKGADVSWISCKENQEEFIILPTVCYKWRQMSKENVSGYGWKIKDNIKVYITEDYASNNILLNSTDNELRYIKDWFNSEFGMRKIDTIKYFNLFIKNGYDTFESIKQIKCFDDLNNIGIVKIGHVKKMLKQIKLLEEYMNKMSIEKKSKSISAISIII